MRIEYEYRFMDGFIFRSARELPFAVLKAAVDVHNGLRACKKIVIMEVNE